ncbi:MAG: DUF262 domain-containing protein [Flavobacteriales bacterium]|nr:DUF262 domain-containing protein [Flavobacteriales bacterium]
MALEKEIETGRQDIYAEGYDMSFGELVSLYKNKELIVNPAYQRFFRWEISQKTRFIESIVLRIPVPPIFVFQKEDGVWELIDGLQRLSTVFEFMGILRKEEEKLYPPSVMEGTKLLPSLSGKQWEKEDDEANSLSSSLRIEIKRTRIRVEILQKGSTPNAKFELFQRLNTGGSPLSEQEVRNCVMIMIDPTFYEWVEGLSKDSAFSGTVELTEAADVKRKDMEFALRFLTFMNVPYTNGLDVHEYLDSATIKLATDKSLNRSTERNRFKETFALIQMALGSGAFRRFDGAGHSGQFLTSIFEVLAVGVASNLTAIQALGDPSDFITKKAQGLGSEETYRRNTGAGVRGTTRLSNLLSWGVAYLKP